MMFLRHIADTGLEDTSLANTGIEIFFAPLSKSGDPARLLIGAGRGAPLKEQCRCNIC
jgi:hypothetical protein